LDAERDTQIIMVSFARRSTSLKMVTEHSQMTPPTAARVSGLGEMVNAFDSSHMDELPPTTRSIVQ
jgi:hypothetical protein